MIRLARATLLALVLAAPAAVPAQHGAGSAAPSRTAPREASQYDFLVGEWELEVRVPASGLAQRLHGAPKLVGTWKAWRALDGWGIEDELRITDAAGNPSGFTQSVRVYDAAARRWTISSLDVYSARFATVTAEWRDGAMHLTSKGTDRDGKPYLSRTRIYDITPTSFRLQQDRSFDDGRKWSEGTLRIEAKRTAATAAR